MEKKLLNLQIDAVSQEEFEQAFEQVLEFVKQNKELTDKELENLRELYTTALSEIKSNNVEVFSSLEAKLSAFFDEKTQEITKSHEDKMYQIDLKLSEVKNGEDADEEVIVSKVLTQIKLPEYKETVLDGGEEIVNKINDLPIEKEYQIDNKHIKGFIELEKVVDSIKNRPLTPGGGVMGRDLVKDIDISTQLDGVTKTFNIQAVWNVFSVNLSSYPYGSLRKGIDYNFTPTSVTFTDEIDAETQLSIGQKCILTVIQG